MKKVLSITLAITIMLMLFVFIPPTAGAKRSGDFVYIVSDNKAEIISYTGEASDLVIPSEIDGIPVVWLGYQSFKDCNSLKSVTIGDYVASIDRYAFDGCDSLKNIYFPSSLMVIDRYALDSTAWYDNQPDGVVYAGNIAYSLKGDYPTDVIVKDGTKAITKYAFSGYLDIESVTIPDTVVVIGESAFYSCTSLKTVTMGDSVTTIGSHAFGSCISLENITFSESLTDVGSKAFYATTWYEAQPEGIVYAGKAAYSVKGECPADVTLKEGTKAIADSAFSKCNTLKSITIPDSVTAIGMYAFSECKLLETVSIGESVSSIGNHCFDGCRLLKSVIIPDSVQTIGDYTFYGCKSLESVSVGNGVINIGEWVFEGCRLLEKVIIPSSVVSISWNSFGGCDDLIIYGYSGSEAERYANSNLIPFIDLTESPIEIPTENPTDELPDKDEFLLGDVDSDGSVTIFDATTIQRQIAGLAVSSYSEKAADCDGDGRVTVVDATAIQRHLAGLSTNAKGIGEPIQ